MISIGTIDEDQENLRGSPQPSDTIDTGPDPEVPMGEQDDAENEQQPVEIMIDPSQMAGVWANFARVSHSDHEFTLDFVRLEYATQPHKGLVVARVSVSPLFITQLIEALGDNWKKYARKALPKEVYDDDDHGQDD